MHTIKNFRAVALDRGLLNRDMQDAYTAIIKFDNGDWIGVSQYHDEDYWVADCAFRDNGMPVFSNRTGGRGTAVQCISDEDVISTLNTMKEEYNG